MLNVDRDACAALQVTELSRNATKALSHRKAFPGSGLRSRVVTSENNMQWRVTQRKHGLNSPNKRRLRQQFECGNEALRCVVEQLWRGIPGKTSWNDRGI